MPAPAAWLARAAGRRDESTPRPRRHRRARARGVLRSRAGAGAAEGADLARHAEAAAGRRAARVPPHPAGHRGARAARRAVERAHRLRRERHCADRLAGRGPRRQALRRARRSGESGWTAARARLPRSRRRARRGAQGRGRRAAEAQGARPRAAPLRGRRQPAEGSRHGRDRLQGGDRGARADAPAAAQPARAGGAHRGHVQAAVADRRRGRRAEGDARHGGAPRRRRSALHRHRSLATLGDDRSARAVPQPGEAGPARPGRGRRVSRRALQRANRADRARGRSGHPTHRRPREPRERRQQAQAGDVRARHPRRGRGRQARGADPELGDRHRGALSARLRRDRAGHVRAPQGEAPRARPRVELSRGRALGRRARGGAGRNAPQLGARPDGRVASQLLERVVVFAIRQRLFVLVATAALVWFGWNALRSLSIEAFPDVQDVQVQVVTQYPGRAPEEVERAVTLPIEREMAGVPRMSQLRSVSIFGLSMVTMTFLEGTDDYFARQQVLEKLQTVQLPPGVQPALAPLSTAVGEIYRYVLDAPEAMPGYEVRAIQDWILRPALRMVPHVADVVSFGGSIKEYQVRVNPYALKRYGVTLEQVANALGEGSSNTGGGLIPRGDEALVVRGIGLFGGVDDIANVAVLAKDGKTVRVRDVAEVAIGPRPLSGIVALDEHNDVVEGIVLMVKGANAREVVGAVRERVDELQAKLPPGVKIRPIYQRTDLIDHTVRTVSENLLLGAGLVIAILVVFLRDWRAALIVAAVIPLSLLFAFILIQWRGVSANLISLGAVDFGIIIDSAVVPVEALMVRLAVAAVEGHGHVRRLDALRATAVELGRPILFAKAIIITAFLPIYTFQRVEGRIFAPVAYTLSFTLIGAVLLTFTLVLTLLAIVLQHRDMAERHSAWMDWLKQRYRNALAATDRRRFLVVADACDLLAVALVGAPFLGSEFLPKLDEGNIWLTITLPPPTSLERTRALERDVRTALRGYAETRSVITQVWRPDDGTDPKGPNNIEMLIDLEPRSEWHFPNKEALVDDMARKLSAIPGLPTNFSQVIQDNVEESLSGVKGEIAIKVFGPDLEILEYLGTRIAGILRGIRGAADVAAIHIGGQTELAITIDRERTARLGLSPSDVNKVIETALAGRSLGTFYEGDRRFDIVVRLDQPYRDAVDDIGHLQVTLPGSNATVPLDSIAKIEVRQGATRVQREAGGRIVAVKANLRGRDQGSFVAEAQRRVRAEVPLPPGYSITWGGQFENQQRTLKRLRVIVPASALGIFALLFWAFRSVRKAGLILAMVPFTLIGGIAGLAAAGLHLSISAAVGFIAVAGISVQNGVIMVEHIVERMRKGAELGTAVVEGAVARLRPILMTALMAGLGLLPAALSQGIGSETQRPFAVVIVGGIVTGTLFTLLLLPLAFKAFHGERED